jgi:hypothetical protein
MNLLNGNKTEIKVAPKLRVMKGYTTIIFNPEANLKNKQRDKKEFSTPRSLQLEFVILALLCYVKRKLKFTINTDQ